MLGWSEKWSHRERRRFVTWLLKGSLPQWLEVGWEHAGLATLHALAPSAA